MPRHPGSSIPAPSVRRAAGTDADPGEAGVLHASPLPRERERGGGERGRGAGYGACGAGLGAGGVPAGGAPAGRSLLAAAGWSGATGLRGSIPSRIAAS